MRRLALVVTALAVACSSDKDDGPTPDATPPAVPMILVPSAGAHLVATDLAGPNVGVSGTAEGGATVEVEVGGVFVPPFNAVAPSDGTWSVSVPAAGGGYTVRARATDPAGNASAWSSTVSFTVDTAPFAAPFPADWPYVPVTSWGQAVPVTPNDASGLGELFPGQANSWVVDRDFSLAAGYGLQYANALVLYAGTPTSPRSHASLLADLVASAFTPFPGDQAFSEAVFLTPTVGDYDTLRSVAVSNGQSMGLAAISPTSSAYLNGTSHSVLGGYLLEFTSGETYTFGWTHQAVLDAGKLAGADAAPYAPEYQVVLRTPGLPNAMIGEPLFSSSTSVARATESVTRTGLPQAAVLQFELRSAAPGYVELDDLTLSSSTGPIALRNPSFDLGFDGWASALSNGSSQNVRSGGRDVGALRVTRTFYASSPAYAGPSTWGRMVDVFENPGASDVTTTVTYATLLGGTAPLATATQGGRAVVGWDADATVRDVGIVFGTGTAYVADGSPFVFVTHDLTVPAGGKVALAHFVVQLGEAAGGSTSVDVPAGTDDECAAILANFTSVWSTTYRAYLEPGLFDLVANL